ncbi:hypothetical protein ACH58_25945 [Achromobacter xylosoxidans]|uniref:DUF262 domain-containing protein n=1 Tax=Alcaligenes xylosoxydans xylosoxydans TaxID=85698 RepID=UPI00064D8813|nr:DUF262 domain-containing protein [Achromobacter xylosoxidans]KMJ87821.1 hypothetical protein ACH58_25945 [Achromobacter xylosoxidans]
MSFSITDFHGSTVWKLYRIRERIQLDPDYQRLGGVWAPENRQLLIDTIINGFDIPKLYMHKFNAPLHVGRSSYDYAIVDGRQRLEALWSFIDGKIALADDFEYFKDKHVAVGGMTYQELATHYPELKADFDGFPLAVVLIETDELDMIEEMFSRLNEAAPLTAPEKRNAFGGPGPVAIRKLAKEVFFTQSLPFPNKRYRHYDLATKFLMASHENRVVDTKKSRLDDFVASFVDQPRTKSLPCFKEAQRVVQAMSRVFSANDALLRQVGMVMLYFHLFRVSTEEGWGGEVTRKKLLDFEKKRIENRQHFEQGKIDKVNKDLVDFDSYAQSPNDGGAIRFRLQVLLDQGFGRKHEDDEN